MSLALFSCLMVLIVLATIGASIPLSMIISAIVYLAVKGQDMGLAAEQIIQGLYDSFVILAIPLFIVAANFMNAGTISDRLNTFCLAIVGRLKGGMGHVNVLNSLVFAGMSGSAVADVVGMGKMSIDMMIKNNRYPLGYAAAITAATAVVGPIIPPSIPMVIYALVSDASIGYLFIGGVVPGLIMAAAQMIIVDRQAKAKNFPVEAPVPLRDLPGITWRAFPALMMPVVLLGGIYSGITTPTEAAAVAAAWNVAEADLGTTAFAAGTKGAKVAQLTGAGRVGAARAPALELGRSLFFAALDLHPRRATTLAAHAALAGHSVDAARGVGACRDCW